MSTQQSKALGFGLNPQDDLNDLRISDKAIPLLEHVKRFIPVGYSMGGPVAQLVWRRHRQRVQGLVLCATAPFFRTSRQENMGFLGTVPSGLRAR